MNIPLSNSNAPIHLEVKGLAFHSGLETPYIRLCGFMEVQDRDRIKAQPNLRQPKHFFCNIDLNAYGVAVVSIDRSILGEWSQIACRLQV